MINRAAPEGGDDAAFQAQQMHGTGVAARLHNAGKRVVNSDYTARDHLRELLDRMPRGATILELGSGSRRLRDDVVNVDLFRFPNIDVVADIAALPVAANRVDAIILDSVIEHVPDPREVAAQIHRVLKPGGTVLCVAPFVFPYHGYPKHYGNFSKDGLELLFRDFSSCTVETSHGPTAALTNLISEYFAVAFSGRSKLAYTIVKGLALLPIFLLKYVDALWKPAGNATRIASTLCAIAVK